MPRTARRTPFHLFALLLLFLGGPALPASARPLQSGDGSFGAVEWDSLVALQRAAEGREPAFRFGPILGTTYLRAGDATFFAPTYGGSISKNAYTLFLGDGRIGGEDRVRFAGLRRALPGGLFVQLTGLDARQVISDLDQYTHRAVGAAGSVGFQWRGRRLHGSVAAGAGGFDLETPKQVVSETVLGLHLAGHAGFTF
jgi:hypothetical protein